MEFHNWVILHRNRKTKPAGAPNIAAAGVALARLTATSTLAAADNRGLGEGAVRAAAESRAGSGDGVRPARAARRPRLGARSGHEAEHSAEAGVEVSAARAVRVAARTDARPRPLSGRAARPRLRGGSLGHAA